MDDSTNVDESSMTPKGTTADQLEVGSASPQSQCVAKKGKALSNCFYQQKSEPE